MKERHKPTKLPKSSTDEDREFARRLRQETQRLVREHISAKNEEFAVVLAAISGGMLDDWDDPFVVELVKRFSRQGDKSGSTTLRAHAIYGVSNNVLAKLLDVSRAHGFTFNVEGEYVNAEVTRVSFSFAYVVEDEAYYVLESEARMNVQDALRDEAANRETAAVDTSSTSA
jgi:hypothetical protein